jgi:hypothetical protein
MIYPAEGDVKLNLWGSQKKNLLYKGKYGINIDR